MKKVNRQQTHYFHCDQIGVPREMINGEGNLVWFGNYYGCGKPKSETNTSGTAHPPFHLQNHYCDLETELHYNFFRYCDPDAGRFVNQDPIGLEGGEEIYTAPLHRPRRGRERQRWCFGFEGFKSTGAKVGVY